MFQSLLTVLVWTVATGAYVSYRRDGTRGFRRLAAFCLGFPWTFCSAFIVPRGRPIRNPGRKELEDEQRLLMEIRRDRARRIRLGQRSDEAADVVGDEEA